METKKKISLLLFGMACTLLFVFGRDMTAKAASASLKVKEVDYNNGKIEIDFNQNVRWKSSAKVTITKGTKTYQPIYVEKDSDEIDIYVRNLPQKGTIKVKITGVRGIYDSKYRTVTTSFKTTSKDVVVKKTEYEGDGKVEVDFTTKVHWKSNAKVTVYDQNGKKYTAYIFDKDNNECDFIIKNLKSSSKKRTFTFAISGVKAKSASKYTTVSGSFVVPKTTTAASVSVQKSEFDFEDNELNIEFNKYVDWNNPTIKITDSSGKSYEAFFTETDDDECTIMVYGLTLDKKYNFKITGIKKRGTTSYGTVSGSFYASYDD